MRTRQRALAGIAALAVLTGGACTRTPDRSTEAFCQQVPAVEGLDHVLAGSDADRATEQVEQLRRLQEVAPAEIEPAVATVVSVADEMAEALAATPDPAVAATEVFRRHQGDIDAIRDAGRALEEYAQQHCGVQLNPTGTALPGGAGPSAPATTATTAPAR